MLEGKNVDLRILEKEDLPLLAEWFNKPEVFGEYNPLRQMSKTDTEKILENPNELKPFIIETRDGSKIGFITHFYVLHIAGRQLEIGYSLVPNERGKGYCSEAVKIMVDYLFLSKDIGRIQAQTDPRNTGSQKVLEKAGFKKEGKKEGRKEVKFYSFLPQKRRRTTTATHDDRSMKFVWVVKS